MSFFKTKACRVFIDQMRVARDFHLSLVNLIKRNGMEKEALTVFDLEEMIASLPGADPDLSLQIAKLASNDGKEYVSAHELEERLRDHVQRMFKITYLSYLLANKKISLEDLGYQPEEEQDSGYIL